MAQEGMRFTDFYVASPVCSPSRAALMTGCYPKRIGLDSGHEFAVLFPGDPIGLGSREATIPHLLKEAGYRTKMIGKWHLGDQPEFLPTRHGFDSYFGLPYSNDMLPDHPANDRFHFPPLPLMTDEEVVETDPNQAALTDRYTAEAIRFIEDNARKEPPFFLYLAHMYVHLPIHTPMKYEAASDNGSYGAAVAHMDQSTGCILDTLKELGIDKNTLGIFTSDNGSNGQDGGSNAPLRGTKGTTWEGGMREPCIMRWPKRVTPLPEIIDRPWALTEPVDAQANIEISNTEATIRNGKVSARIRDIHTQKGHLELVELRHRELMVRWYQYAVFTPVFRTHGKMTQHWSAKRGKGLK